MVATTGILPAIVARLRIALARPSQRYHAFVVDGVTLGRLDGARAARVARFTDVFTAGDDRISFDASCNDVSTRTAALAHVARVLASEGALTAWRDECYAVAADFGA